ncbi:DUF5591 domain-containing protein, partial [[Eubacterium] cellulosolvens]
LVEARCRSHPSLLDGLRRVGKYQTHMTCSAPSTKRRGIFFFDSTSLQRPEYVMHSERLLRDYVPPREARIVLLVPVGSRRPSDSRNSARVNLTGVDRGMHVCLYFPPYGLVPSELEDTFPFSQTETRQEPDRETLAAMAETVQSYLSKNGRYQALVLVRSSREWQLRFANMCRRICRKIGVRFSSHSDKEIPSTMIEKRTKEKRYPDKTTKRRPTRRES